MPKITKANYAKIVADYGLANLRKNGGMLDVLNEGYDFVADVQADDWSMYKSEPEIAEVVDIYFDKLGKWLDKQHGPTKTKASATSRATTTERKRKPATKSSTAMEKKPRAARKPKATTVPKAKSDAKEKLPPIKVPQGDTASAVLLRAYINMHGKVATYASIGNLLKRFQRAMVNEQINTTDAYASQVKTAQKKLLAALDSAKEHGCILIEHSAISLEGLEGVVSSNQHRGNKFRIKELNERGQRKERRNGSGKAKFVASNQAVTYTEKDLKPVAKARATKRKPKATPGRKKRTTKRKTTRK